MLVEIYVQTNGRSNGAWALEGDMAKSTHRCKAFVMK